MSHSNKIVFLLLIPIITFSQEILIYNTDLTVWGREQVIRGELVDFANTSGNLFINDSSLEFEITDQKIFEVSVTLDNDVNNIFIVAQNGNTSIYSDTLKLNLGFKIRPEIYSYCNVQNLNVTLHGKVISNPYSTILDFYWSSDIRNPSLINIINPNDSVTSISFSSSIAEGEYYFNFYAVDENDDTIKARTFFTVKNGEIIPFNIYTDHAAWIDSAIIYEITPYNFVNPRGNFKQIIKKIPDFVRLGVNTIWIQPVYKTKNGGQGYDVTNYFSVREDYGTEEELRELIKQAKQNNLRVIFDFVANHSSIYHPYARHASEFGENSHYWNYYQRETDNSPYSQHYSFYQSFINYFWDQLPNLNFNNPEVEKWISEAINYWVEKFNIDGYRFDAIWGVNARKPSFMKKVRFKLKSLKPELLFLAEDKATWNEAFDENFDMAFDWGPEEDWVSHWTWQTNYSANGNQTIFNSPSQKFTTKITEECNYK